MSPQKIILILLLLIHFNCPAQQSSLSKGVNYLSSFIASDYFNELYSSNSQTALIDTIYYRAVHFYNFDYSEALLALMFATLPYNVVPIKLPLFKITLNYPLTSADDSTFKLKNDNLPKYFLHDSPTDDYGDKDKLAHFFGSAFLSYTGKFFDLGNVIGYFVEVFEESFKVQSSVDERDLRVNNLGKHFGEVLKSNRNSSPSSVIILSNLIH